MLGEQIGEGKGKRSYRKVVSAEGGTFSIEVSFESTGKMLGVDAHEIGTYCSQPRADGSLYGEGHGVVLTADGGVATWKGGGVGKILPRSEEHTSELQSLRHLVCRLLLEKKK